MTVLSQPRSVRDGKSLRSAKNTSGADIGPHLCVKRHTALNEIVLTGGNADPIAGVTVDNFVDDDDVLYTYQADNIAICTAGAAVTIGDLLMPTAAGKVITRTGTNSIVGTALTSATADNDLIEVELDRQTGA